MTEVRISLGSRSSAERMFSYPNAGHETQSLEQTVQHYLGDSLRREGFVGVQVHLVEAAGAASIVFDLPDPTIAAAVQLRYQAFFDTGTIGFQDAIAFQASGKWDPTWKFLLPLGVPLEQATAVEIMDFPPLTLITKQDYLNSKTTGRWWELLEMNGVADDEKARFSCILDIVPVAAPAGDGTKLDNSGIYGGPFDSYSLTLLKVLAKAGTPGTRRPLMALGRPIRAWVQRVWNLALNVGDLGTLKLEDGSVCQVLGANHPSFFFYAVNSSKGPGAKQKNLAAGLAVLKQDIVASAWQAEMGRRPDADAHTTFQQCHARWANRDDELLEVVKRQGGISDMVTLGLRVDEIEEHLLPAPDLRLLEREFYLTGRAELDPDLL